MNMLSFFVPGVAAPQGSKRHVGRGVMIESSKRLKPWRKTVTGAAKTALLYSDSWEASTDAPVSVALSFQLPRPKRVPRSRRGYPVTKPDGDKLARAVLDSLTDADVFADDSQVVSLHVTKTYANPGVLITVRELGTFDPYGEDES